MNSQVLQYSFVVEEKNASNIRRSKLIKDFKASKENSKTGSLLKSKEEEKRRHVLDTDHDLDTAMKGGANAEASPMGLNVSKLPSEADGESDMVVDDDDYASAQMPLQATHRS